MAQWKGTWEELNRYMNQRKFPSRSRYYDEWKAGASVPEDKPMSPSDSIQTHDFSNRWREVAKDPSASRDKVLELIEVNLNDLYQSENKASTLGMSTVVGDFAGGLLNDLLRHPSLKQEDFTTLLKTPLKLEHRVAMLENPSFPEGYLNMLGTRRDLRPYVAKNPKVNLKLLEKMSEDADEVVRVAVAQNPKTPKEVIEKLKQDLSETVRTEAVKRTV